MESSERDMNPVCRNDYHRSSERILAEPGIEQRPPVPQVLFDTDSAPVKVKQKTKDLNRTDEFFFNTITIRSQVLTTFTESEDL